jgi:hypothetical protein
MDESDTCEHDWKMIEAYCETCGGHDALICDKCCEVLDGYDLRDKDRWDGVLKLGKWRDGR